MTALVFVYLFLCGFLSAQSPPEKIEVNGYEYKLVYMDVRRSPRMVNGEESQLFTRPYMASIQVYISPYGWFHYCGAVIYERCKLVTAAHCLVPFPASSVRVVVGILDLSKPPLSSTQFLNVSALVPREDYSINSTAVLNDIGVVLLETPMEYNPNVKPAKLAVYKNGAHNDCVISGWGRTTPRGSLSTTLVEAKIATLNFTECLAIHQQVRTTVTPNQICARDDGSDGVISTSCNGDSGGPLMCGNNSKNIYGITSYTMDNCQGILPVVFTCVAPYIKWIRLVDHEKCA